MSKRADLSIILSIFLGIFLPFASLFAASSKIKSTPKAYSGADIGWVAQKNAYNLCHGYYNELPILYIPNPLVASQSDNYDIKADQVTYSFKGISTLKGHVRVTQPDSEFTADIAHIYPDQEGKATLIKGEGNVRLRQPGELVVAKTGEVDLVKKIITLRDLIYRMAFNKNKTEVVKNPKTGKFEKHLYQMNAWGKADKLVRPKRGVIDLHGATYTTCSPDSECWHLSSSFVRLNSNSGRGYAWNTRLSAGPIPLLYMPYFNFPIDKRRQTGFLLPSMGNSNSAGWSFSAPFYLNIAPNYDATVTPTAMSKRGVLWNGLFRFLTPHNNGHFLLGYIDSDRAFRKFQNQATSEWAGRPTLHELERANDNRRSFNFEDSANFNSHWTGQATYNDVSDDYFLQDFGTSAIDNSDNQLLRQAELNYAGDYSTFLINAQGYQTLHPVNQADVLNQYARIPQIEWGINYPDARTGFNYGLQTEATRFWEDQNPGDTTSPVVGNRLDARPSLSLPFSWPFAYFTPRVQMQATKYELGHTPEGQPDNPGVAIPMFDVSSGLYFDRDFKVFNKEFDQTLEPEVYYLYVPYRDQNQLPYFDTTSQTFGYNMLFADNRFSGVDRIGDANQAAWGLTSRLLDSNTGTQWMSVSLGQLYYFRDRKVTLCYDNDQHCNVSPTDRQTVSPLAAMGTFNIFPAWSVIGGFTWNDHLSRFDNQNAGLQYRPDDYHIINFSYNYAKGGDVLPGLPADSPKNDLRQTDINGYWRLTNHWSLLGRWNYNWSHEHVQAFFYGGAYESCCWAIRLVAGRTFMSTGPAPAYRNTYNNMIYLQFAFKGLGNVGGAADTLLKSAITGYTDHFGEDN